jgi:Tfp pilus assembly protein PilX
MKKIAALLKSRRGESLMESIVSIMVFTILVAAVTTIISVSLRITSTATREATDMQNAANAALQGIDDTGRSPVERAIPIIFTVDGTALPPITVIEASNGDFIAFRPQ